MVSLLSSWYPVRTQLSVQCSVPAVPTRDSSFQLYGHVSIPALKPAILVHCLLLLCSRCQLLNKFQEPVELLKRAGI